MAGTGGEINGPKKAQSIKSSLLGVIIKAQSSLSPTRKSDSSLLKSRQQESSKQSESHLSQKLWFSLKKLSSSASDFSKHAPINWSTYFSASSHLQTTAETPATQPQIQDTTCNSSTSTQSLNVLIADRDEEESSVEHEIVATNPNTQLGSEATVVSSPSSLSSEHLSTTWHVTPATPETISAGGTTPAEDSPVFDWSSFDWKEGESNPPRGLIFPFPIRPISRSESCQSVLMGNTGSQIEFEY